MKDDNDIVLSVKNVSKCFEMYEKPVHRLYQTLCAGKRKFYKEFWALRDISFDVMAGECVGIIGRNGAGKSTLLQIITGTLAPTSGQVASCLLFALRGNGVCAHYGRCMAQRRANPTELHSLI